MKCVCCGAEVSVGDDAVELCWDCIYAGDEEELIYEDGEEWNEWEGFEPESDDEELA